MGAVGAVGTVWAARTGAGTPRAVRAMRTGTERGAADVDADRGPGIRIVRIVPRRGRDDDGPTDHDRRRRDDNRGRRDDDRRGLDDDRFFFHHDGLFFNDDRRRNRVLRRSDAHDDGSRGRRREMARGKNDASARDKDMRGFRLRSKRENGGNSSERAAQRRQKRACLSLRTSEFLIHFLFLPARIGKDERYGKKRQKASQYAASVRERAAMLFV